MTFNKVCSFNPAIGPFRQSSAAPAVVSYFSFFLPDMLPELTGFEKFERQYACQPIDLCLSDDPKSGGVQMVFRYIIDNFSFSEKSEFFRQCVEKGLVNVAEALVDEGVVSLEMEDGWGHNMLFHAAAYGLDSLAAKIVQGSGGPQEAVNAQDRLGNTPFFVSLNRGHFKCAALFLEAGAKWDVQTLAGSSPLDIAFEKNLPLIKAALHNRSIEISPAFLSRYFQLSALHRKILGHAEEILEAAKELPAPCRFSCFRKLLRASDFEMAVQMIKKGVISSGDRDVYGETLLHYAVTSGYLPLAEMAIQLFKEQNVDLDTPDVYGRTALQWACSYDFAPCIKLLIQNGADYNIEDCFFNSAISLLLHIDFSLAKELILEAKKKGDLNCSSIFCSFFELSGAKKHELSRILPIGDLMQIKNLAHIWGVKGEMQKEGLRMRYEWHHDRVLAKSLFESMEKFLADVPQEECYKGLHKKVHALARNLDLSPDVAAERLAQGKTVIYPVHTPGHIAYLLLTKGHVYECNRGGKESDLGVVSYAVGNAWNYENALEKLDRLQYTQSLFTYVQSGLRQDLGLRRDRTLRQKKQTVGNCSATSLKTLFYALLFDEAVRHGLGPAEAEATAHKTYKTFTTWLRDDSLRSYLGGNNHLDARLLAAIDHKLRDPGRLQSHFQDVAKRAELAGALEKSISSAVNGA